MQAVPWKYLTHYGRYIWWVLVGRLFTLLLALVIVCWCTTLHAKEESTVPQIAFINSQIESVWADAGVEPVERATDLEWCRRVYLDLIGRIPTVDEVLRYKNDHSRDKQSVLVDRLLGDDHVSEYAKHWSNVWTTVLVGRDADNQMVDRSGMRKYLQTAWESNVPYDQFVEELLTATGDNADRSEAVEFNGATNFLSGKLGDGALQATAKTAQIFLGLQVQCTQCHNHPFNSGVKQNQFWELNAFFRQTRALRRFGGGRRVSWVELVDEDFAGQGGDPNEAEIFYELRNGLVKVAFPVFIDGTEISRSGLLPGSLSDGTPYGVNRRRELASLIRSDPLFPKALVNRIWAYFLGYGFTRPIDDFGAHNPPSPPALLDGLAQRFTEYSYDLKSLMRWIVLSKPYGLSSRITSGSEKDAPGSGEPPYFSRFYVRQMGPEQLYDSLMVATKTNRVGDAERQDRWLSQFVMAFGTDEGDTSTTFNGTIPQILMLFNGDLVQEATSLNQDGFLDQVIVANRKNQDKINALYVASLSRWPSSIELRYANQLLLARQGQVKEALQDIWWALLNSNEFILNH
jgi:hypothetical protein